MSRKSWNYTSTVRSHLSPRGRPRRKLCGTAEGRCSGSATDPDAPKASGSSGVETADDDGDGSNDRAGSDADGGDDGGSTRSGTGDNSYDAGELQCGTTAQ